MRATNMTIVMVGQWSTTNDHPFEACAVCSGAAGCAFVPADGAAVGAREPVEGSVLTETLTGLLAPEPLFAFGVTLGAATATGADAPGAPADIPPELSSEFIATSVLCIPLNTEAIATSWDVTA